MYHGSIPNLAGGGRDVGKLAHRRVPPVVLRREVERRPGELVTDRIVLLELLPRAHEVVVPVIDALRIEVGLAHLAPVLTGVRLGVRPLVESLVAGVLMRRASAATPRRIDGSKRTVDRMAELVDADRFVVVAIDREGEEVLLAEARRPSPGPPDALVLVGRVARVPVLRHVRIDLVLADDDEVHAVPHHRLDDVGAPGEHARDDRVRPLERGIVNHRRGSDRHPTHVDVLPVESPGDLSVCLPDQLEERLGGTSDSGRLLPGGHLRRDRSQGLEGDQGANGDAGSHEGAPGNGSHARVPATD